MAQVSDIKTQRENLRDEINKGPEETEVKMGFFEKMAVVRADYNRRKDQINEAKDAAKKIKSEMKAMEYLIKNERIEKRAHEVRAAKSTNYDLVGRENERAAQWGRWIEEDLEIYKELSEKYASITEKCREMQDLNRGLYDVWGKKIQKEQEADHPVRRSLMDLWTHPHNLIYWGYRAIRDAIKGAGLSLETAEKTLQEVDTQNRVAEAEKEKPDDQIQEAVDEISSGTIEVGEQEVELSVPEQCLYFAELCAESGKIVMVDAESKDGEDLELNFGCITAGNQKSIVIKDAQKNIPLVSLGVVGDGDKIPDSKNIVTLKLGDKRFTLTKADFETLTEITKDREFAPASQERVDKQLEEWEELRKSSEAQRSTAEILKEKASEGTKKEVNEFVRPQPGKKDPPKDTKPKDEPKKTKSKSKEKTDRESKEAEKKAPKEKSKSRIFKSKAEREAIKRGKEAAKVNQAKESEQAKSEAGRPEEEPSKEQYGLTTIKLDDGKTIDITYDNQYKAEILESVQEAFLEAEVAQSITDKKSRYNVSMTPNVYDIAMGDVATKIRDKVRDTIAKAAPETNTARIGRTFNTNQELCAALIGNLVKAQTLTDDKTEKKHCAQATRKILTAYNKVLDMGVSNPDLMDSSDARNESWGRFLVEVNRLADRDKDLGPVINEAIANVEEEVVRGQSYAQNRIDKLEQREGGITEDNAVQIAKYVEAIITANTSLTNLHADPSQANQYGYIKTEEDEVTEENRPEMYMSKVEIIQHADQIVAGKDGDLYDKQSGSRIVTEQGNRGCDLNTIREIAENPDVLFEEQEITDGINQEEETQYTSQMLEVPDLGIPELESLGEYSEQNTDEYDYAY